MRAGVLYGVGGALLIATAITYIVTEPEAETTVIHPHSPHAARWSRRRPVARSSAGDGASDARRSCFAWPSRRCTPEIVSGSYLCGPERLSRGAGLQRHRDKPPASSHTCVLASLARPFACAPTDQRRARNSRGRGVPDPEPRLRVAAVLNNGCMLGDDSADWVKFVAPSVCTAVDGASAADRFRSRSKRSGSSCGTSTATCSSATDGACARARIPAACVAASTSTLVPGHEVRRQGPPDRSRAIATALARYNRYTLSVQLGHAGLTLVAWPI